MDGYFDSQKEKNIKEEDKQIIEKAHQILRTVFDIIPVSIIITRRGDGATLYANRVALDTFDCKSFEEASVKYKGLDLMPEIQPDGRRSVSVIAEIWNRNEGIEEIRFIKLNGDFFLARVVYCLINFFGAAASLLIIDDITVEKEHMQMLKEIALKEREASRLKSRFLIKVSNEIRASMNLIIGISKLALNEKDMNFKNQYISTIKQACSGLQSIINDIHDFSKYEHNS